ncbi:TDT family transporter [Aestuariirhabdus sp. Z084]|uniref:TDT family transporter n=1 Tax=Aestuariirhabdus haliotis TaxID=2918751 RepID=UPI00201B3D75|nr:TDT family transporter [Aestuariirhabdus haliotis]MCL6416922.1 TDT family transporter [Aestuariirhabdus haliotis]MCL6420916.1 TDT family transporter [Aestuariirhabdus haliotis]
MSTNLKKLSQQLRNFPTPVAGLALGIASIGIILDAVLIMGGVVQTLTAIIAGLLLSLLSVRFVLHPGTLLNDLKHPVVGSVAPTFAMGLMLVSNAIIQHHHEQIGHALWLAAVILHAGFLVTFVYHRLLQFEWEHMVPSWFVPPVGIVVAAVSYHGESFGLLYTIAELCLYFGLVCYAIMLPLMFYRLIFKENIQPGAQPTIAILAAPASLSIAGYLSLIENPYALVILVLFGIAVLMTFIVYIAFAQLLLLPFTPGYAAFTFPMAIGATALFKTADQLASWNVNPEVIYQVLILAKIELALATLVISYVTLRFVIHFAKPKNDILSTN